MKKPLLQLEILLNQLLDTDPEAFWETMTGPDEISLYHILGDQIATGNELEEHIDEAIEIGRHTDNSFRITLSSGAIIWFAGDKNDMGDVLDTIQLIKEAFGLED